LYANTLKTGEGYPCLPLGNKDGLHDHVQTASSASASIGRTLFLQIFSKFLSLVHNATGYPRNGIVWKPGCTQKTCRIAD
jgi:hypothetical protein